jgi:hypothetical protein
MQPVLPRFTLHTSVASSAFSRDRIGGLGYVRADIDAELSYPAKDGKFLDQFCNYKLLKKIILLHRINYLVSKVA